MSLTALLEISIALLFLYLLFSQITLSIMELYAGVANMRGAFQYRQLCTVLGEKSTELIYGSAPIKALNRPNPTTLVRGFQWVLGGKANAERPSYISDAVFADVVLALAQTAKPDSPAQDPPAQDPVTLIPDPPAGLKDIATNGANLPAENLRELLASQLRSAAMLAGTSGKEAQLLRQSLLDWYNSLQQQLTGRYKRKLRPWLFGIGFVVAIICNVDTLQVIQYLRTHPTDRQQAVALATQYVKANQAGGSPLIPGSAPDYSTDSARRIRERVIADYITTKTNELVQQQMPIGWWQRQPTDFDSTNRETFYKPVAGGYVQAQTRHFQFTVANATGMQQLVESLPTNCRTELQNLKVNEALRATQLAQQPPADYAKLEVARRAVQTAQSVLDYYYPTSNQPSDVANLKNEYNCLLDSLDKHKPMWWGYKPLYAKYTPVANAPATKPGGPGGITQLTPVALTPTYIERDSEEGKRITEANVNILDGKPRYIGRSFNTWNIVGWLLTGLAMMVGAPFWFDLLGRFVNIRNVGLKPSTS